MSKASLSAAKQRRAGSSSQQSYINRRTGPAVNPKSSLQSYQTQPPQQPQQQRQQQHYNNNRYHNQQNNPPRNNNYQAPQSVSQYETYQNVTKMHPHNAIKYIAYKLSLVENIINKLHLDEFDESEEYILNDENSETGENNENINLLETRMKNIENNIIKEQAICNANFITKIEYLTTVNNNICGHFTSQGRRPEYVLFKCTQILNQLMHLLISS